MGAQHPACRQSVLMLALIAHSVSAWASTPAATPSPDFDWSSDPVEQAWSALPRFTPQPEVSASPAPASGMEISTADAQRIAHRVWENECGGTVEGLTSWNEGEQFASLGIGHFIWYPAGPQGPSEESFPRLLTFLAGNGAALPEMLEYSAGGDRVLTRRVANSPPERHEERWLPGWRARVRTYRTGPL
jgi:hypothetical protein